MEQAWTAIPLFAHKLKLKWHYIYLRPAWGIVKSLRSRGVRLHSIDYDAEIRRARAMLVLEFARR